MKGIRILLLLLLLSRIASWGQSTLRPRVIKQDSVELRCFYPNQYADIVGRISNELYCDSIEIVNQKTIRELDSAIVAQKQQQSIMRGIIDADYGQIRNINILSQTLRLDLAESQKKSRKQKRWKYFFVGLSVALGTVAVIK